MRLNEVIKTTPINAEMTVRGDEIRGITSCRAGKIIPVAYFPLLREDRVSRGSLRLTFDMSETIHSLMNAVNVTAYAHFVPFLAFERFNGGMDTFNRSYEGEGEPHNNTPVPFFTSVAYNRNLPFWKSLGVHWRPAAQINAAPLEAYNVMVNHRRKSRSQHLPLRDRLDGTLAPAFWKNPNMAHIVPDFDQAAMDGEVELQIVNPRVSVKSRGALRTTEGPTEYSVTGGQTFQPEGRPGETILDWEDRVFVDMQSAGIKLSLANIELAKKVASFAKLREKYAGLDDDHIIDLLMDGIRVPDEALKQPILLDKKSTIFGYSERHAMDGASLDKSVTTGQTSLDLNFRTPAMNTGGVILITVEIVPEQLYERQFDTFLGTLKPDELPHFMRDYLDPEKVQVVPNKFVDVLHSNPEGTFGYAPLNHGWKRSFPRVGGKYMRQTPDAFVEDRQRFWSVEKTDPRLTEDFYMVGDLPHSVFMDTVSDAFEILTLGSVQIVGRTVFGKELTEDTNDYDEIMAQVDTSRIQQTPKN